MGALASKAQQRDVAERVAQLAAGQRGRVRRARRLRAARRGRRRRRVLRADAAALPRAAGPTTRSHDVEAFGPVSTLMPYDDLDEALALAARGTRQPGRRRWSRATRRSPRARCRARRVARPHARARPRGRGRVDRPRLAAAAAEARRPGPRRRRRGARRHPRGQALPAARGGAGLADDAGGGDRRVRARRRGAANRTSIRSASTSRTCRSATRC